MKLIERLLVATAAAVLILSGCSSAVTNENPLAHIDRAITTSQTGTNNGYYYSFWTNGGGSVSMNLGSGGNYSVNWSNAGDFTAGKGWSTGNSNPVTYSGSYSNSGGGACGIYGWTTNPLVEYYIADSSNGITSNSGTTQVGTVTTDGATYNIYKHQQVNQPSIQGTATFWQYISVRQSPRVGGTITVANHFNAWRNAGLNLGSMNYEILLTEGWSGSGSSNITVGSSTGGTPTPTPSPTPTPGSVTLNSWQANSHSSGLNVWTGGTGNWTQGAWIEFNGINISGKTNMNFNLASTGSGSYQIRLDSTGGTQIGQLNYNSTGSWTTYNNQSTSLNLNGQSGSHNLYIVDSAGAANLGTLTLQ